MFVNNLNPILFNISNLEIHYYGLVYVLGFLLTYFILKKNKTKLELNDKQIDDLMFYLTIGMIIGARIFHFLFNEPYLIFSFEFFKIWHGGMSFYGGLIGGLTGIWFYLKKIHKTFLKIVDGLAISITFSLMLGRIANFINSELVGRISNLPFCVIFEKVDNLCRHPYQIYSAISHLILLLILIFVKEKKTGSKFFTFLIGYSLLRFITDFFREDVLYFGLNIWQYFSIIVFIVSIYYWKKLKNI